MTLVEIEVNYRIERDPQDSWDNPCYSIKDLGNYLALERDRKKRRQIINEHLDSMRRYGKMERTITSKVLVQDSFVKSSFSKN